LDHQYIETNDIQLHVVQAGPIEGPLVVLLHGFPEFWYSWKKQIPYLANAGYRVWVPDQRGYNLSAKPDGIEAYSLDKLAADVIGLINAAGQKQIFLVGHDWGAAVAWWVAAKYPGRIARLVVVNVPHWTVWEKNLRSNLAQMRKSWYMFFFQIPWLPEVLARLKQWNMPILILKKSSRPGTFNDSDFEQYRQAWSQPKAYRSMLNWYRAMIQKPPIPPASTRITVPTMLIWGAKDRFLGREMAQPSIDFCDDGRLIFIDEATHWVQHEEAERVNELIDTFLRDGKKT